MVIQPSPIAETSKPLLPRVRLSMIHAPVVVEWMGQLPGNMIPFEADT
jgi:hypothetical protein